MTSYNYIGNQWAGACGALLNGVEKGTPMWRQILNGVNIGVIALCVLLEAVFLFKLFRKKYNE